MSDACRSCSVVVCGREMRAQFLVFTMQDYNVVFGMDWLSQHHATLDCHRGCMIFRPPGLPEFEFLRGAV